MTIEEILRGSIGGFDIETYGWWTNHPVIYMISLATDKGDYVIDTFDKVNNEAIPSALYEGRTARRIVCKTEPELRYRASGLMRNLDLNVWGGQFIKYFDLPNLLKGKDKLFLPSVDNSEPSYTGSTSPFQSFTLNDSLVLDTWDFARNFFSMFLPDNKIETQASFASKFFDFIFKYVKSESYEEQKHLYRKAEAGDSDSAFRLGQYCYDDTIMHHELTKLYLPFLVNIAKITKNDFNSINSCGKKKIASAFWDYMDLKRTSRLRSNLQMYNDFDIYASGKKPFYKFRDETVLSLLSVKEKKGLFRNVHCFYFPFSCGLADFFRQNKATAGLCMKIDEEKNPISKMIYCQMLDALSIEPLRDMIEVKRAQEYEYVFNRKYGFFAGRQFFSSQLKEYFEKGLQGLKQLIFSCKDTAIVNYSNNLLFIQAAQGETEKLAGGGLVYLGECDVISASIGKVIYKLKDEILCSGINIPSKKKRLTLDYESGQKTNLEIRIVWDAVEAIFSGSNPDEIIGRELQAIRDGKIEPTDFISAVRVAEEAKNLPYKTRGRKSNEAIRKLDAKQGETLLYVIVNDQSIKYLGYEPDKDSFYFIERKSVDGKRSAERVYLKYNNGKFENGLKIDADFYIQSLLEKIESIKTVA
jgi:hypothetical protein